MVAQNSYVMETTFAKNSFLETSDLEERPHPTLKLSNNSIVGRMGVNELQSQLSLGGGAYSLLIIRFIKKDYSI